ncbi:hypothetical protein ACVWWI_006315 [Bradyrhizobium sp. USDA 3686]|uniref:hypothetical protein n=1 Tax=Bradyrhizobium canariense TaxID=255045 RepID=UPI001958DE56|nr:hypothetical protein [Bradyrhizobium canariense]MBM7488134.1 hypothetical protein [Bradyrhizobium canariense]
MAKKASKSKARKKKTSKAKRRTTSTVRGVGLSVHEEDHVDGCDIEVDEGLATSDADLPPAKGGVEVARRRRT